VKFQENPSNGNRDFPCGRTEGQTRDEPNCLFSQFCELYLKRTSKYFILKFIRKITPNKLTLSYLQ